MQTICTNGMCVHASQCLLTSFQLDPNCALFGILLLCVWIRDFAHWMTFQLKWQINYLLKCCFGETPSFYLFSSCSFHWIQIIILAQVQHLHVARRHIKLLALWKVHVEKPHTLLLHAWIGSRWDVDFHGKQLSSCFEPSELTACHCDQVFLWVPSILFN